MRDRAEQTGQAQWTLGRGLHLGLYRRAAPDGVLWLLTLDRDDVPPSPTEVQTVRRHFGVPAEAEELATNRLISITWIVPPTVEQIAQGSLFAASSAGGTAR
jgi:hypothetical protein